MPPAVLPDSDDDGDDIAALGFGDDPASSRGRRASADESARLGMDRADERSTGSTEILRRQIQSAERGLLSNSAPCMNQSPSSVSPTWQAAKRRHTAASAADSNVSPEKSLKRTKTSKTYGARHRQIEPAYDSNFDLFRNDDGPADSTSHSARFSEHSGQQSSMPLPAGSTQADFLNHEPTVMFKDTGDTVAESSSEQKRLLEQALASKKGHCTSLTKEAQQTSEQHSSSIPWTASDNADSAQCRQSKGPTNVQAEGRGQAGETDTNGVLPRHRVQAEAEISAFGQLVHDQAGNPEQHDFPNQFEPAMRKPISSPMVEIPRRPSGAAEVADGAPKTKWCGSKSPSRKKVEELSEPLNSDETAIGLPEERYQPRPSRRRATQIVEGPIDYSGLPEKAARVKRTKTTGANLNFATEQNDRDGFQSLKPGVSPPRLSKDDISGQTHMDEEFPTQSHASNAGVIEQHNPFKSRRSIKQQRAIEPSLAGESPARTPRACPEELEPAPPADDKIFIKPAISTPKANSAFKGRRAQTTIFEDHIEFIGSRRSPNLSEQQAKRNSALEDVKNEAASQSQRKRKSTAVDDSDDEDELAKENDPVLKADPPKKRRGRPPKSDKQNRPKAIDSVFKDSEKGNEEAQSEPGQPEEDEPLEERGRDHPAKVASNAEFKDTEKPADVHAAIDQPGKPRNGDADILAVPNVIPNPTPLKASAPATEIPTPSPDRCAEKTISTPQKTSSAAQHSPIKSSSKVPLRVGLSKRSRIPPLLRMSRPPKR